MQPRRGLGLAPERLLECARITKAVRQTRPGAHRGVDSDAQFGRVRQARHARRELIRHRETAEADARAQSQLKVGARSVPQDVSHLKVLNGSRVKRKDKVFESLADRLLQN